MKSASAIPTSSVSTSTTSLIPAMQHKAFAAYAESLVASFLVKNNVRILARNWFGSRGEIDIIGYEVASRTILFIEVKARRVYSYSDGIDPEGAVDSYKRRQYRRLAAEWLHSEARELGFRGRPVRFDVAALECLTTNAKNKSIQAIPCASGGTPEYRLTYFKDAFVGDGYE